MKTRLKFMSIPTNSCLNIIQTFRRAFFCFSLRLSVVIIYNLLEIVKNTYLSYFVHCLKMKLTGAKTPFLFHFVWLNILRANINIEI